MGSVAVRVLGFAVAAAITAYYIALSLPLKAQLFSSVVLVTFAVGIARYRPDMRLFLMLLSTAVSLRYITWRATHTLDFFSTLDAALGLTLFAAELYGLVILLLGYFQTVEPLPRRPVPLPSDPSSLPWVDVFIPTYNEDPSIVGRTAMGALAMDYPRKRVYILDDGRRPEMERLAKEVGCGYLTRGDNRHAKAGNINAALRRTGGDLVAIFDADHIPVRSFLQLTVGFFLQDPKLALVQTPHHFFNPDPFQRNLLTNKQVPAEQELFYHVILPGDDFWNSAFFCGSCALLRRSALLEVGGIAQETVTEDAHTALKLHANGWKSVYLAIPQAAGLATERYAFHVKQRMRWAQGMVQIMRLDNPLTKKGLSLPQRLNYFNAMLHFLFGGPRLVYVVAPLTYLLFGCRPIHSDPWEILVYAMPHILMAGITNSLAFKGFRHSFWAEVYEMAIAWQSAAITTITLFSPRNAKFNVTTKGEGLLERPEFDWRNAKVNLFLAGVSILGLVAAPIRYLYRPLEVNTIFLNSCWTLFNLSILWAAIMVALEQRQMREAYRIDRELSVVLKLRDGREVPARTQDISESGSCVRTPSPILVDELDGLRLIGNQGLELELEVQVMHHRLDGPEQVLGIRFLNVSDTQDRQLVQLIFTAADSWIDFGAPLDNFLRGLFEVLQTPPRVLLSLARQARAAARTARR